MPQVERVDPPYAQVVHHISEQIASGELAPGDRIPSERDLRESWDISKATANKVVARLKSAGLVETVVGSGTVVSDQSVASGVGPRDMWARIKTTGKIRLQSERSVRTIDWVDSGSAPRHIVDGLSGTALSGNLLRRSRVIYRDDMPYSIATSWFLPPLLQQAGSEVIDRLAADAPIPEGTPQFIARSLDRELDGGVDYMEAIGASGTAAETFGLAQGAPILRIVSTSYAGDFPLEVGEYQYPPGTGVSHQYAL